MPEELNTPAAGGEGADKQPDAGENGQSGADNKPDTTEPGIEDAGKGEENKDGGGDKEPKDPDNAKAPKKEPEKIDTIDDGKEPELRKRLSKKDFIIGRQRAKMAKKQAEPEKVPDDEIDDDQDDDDDDEILPEDKTLISKVVAKQIAPIIDKTLAADDNNEVNEFIAANPEFKPYESKVRRYMQHPSRRQLPIKSIFYEVAGDDLLKIGADRARAAEKKAKETQSGGGSNRGEQGKGKSVKDLSREEFEAKKEAVRRGI